MEFTFYVKGMTCGHCVARVKNALEADSHLKVVEIDLSTGKTIVNSHLSPDLLKLQALLDEAGAYHISSN